MSWFARLKNTFHSRAIDESLAAEIEDHLERRAAELRAAGMHPDDAAREARRAFGNIQRVREESREVRSWPLIDTTLRDIRYAWRWLLRSPGFSVTALASLALAIGAITAVYAVIDAAMLRALPVPRPEQLITLSAAGKTDTDAFSYPAYEQLRDAATAAGRARLALVSATNRVEAQTPDRTAPIERVVQQYASGETFEMLAVRPALGQLFTKAQDDAPGPGLERAAVLGFDYWRARFGADPGVLNRSIVINGGTYRIIGVTQPGFFGVEPGKIVDVWLPLTAFDPGVFTNPSARLFHIIGHLSDDTSREALQARLQAAVPDVRVDAGTTGVAAFRRSLGRPVVIIGIVAASILLIAVANVASLLLGRATARSAEMALRLSLGAGRSRLVRQLLTESLLLSALAGAAGWLLANLAAPWLISLLSKSSDPLQLVLSMNTRALWFCVATCAVCAISFGVIPAWTSASVPMRGLRQGAASGSSQRIGRAFVAIQMGFAFCLVIVAFAFLVSLYRLFSVDTGFDANHVTVLTLRTDAGLTRDGLRLTQQLQQQVGALPKVESAAVGWFAIFNGGKRLDGVRVPGKPPAEREDIFSRVSPGYFATLKTPLIEGRDLDVHDTEDRQPIATVVNRSFVREYFDDGGGALGRMFQRPDGAWHRIVGVASDSYYDDLRRGPQPIAYFPMKPPRFFTLYVRSTLDPVTVMKMVEHEATAVSPAMRVVDVTTLKTLVGNTVVTERLLANLGGVFAAIGLVLAAIGAFGVVNYTVVRRTKEIGIRAVLGASRRALVRLVVQDFVWIAAIALTAGFAGAFASLSLVRTHLFGVRATDPVVIIVAGGICLAATVAAVIVPVLRAATIDPMIAVRHE